MTAMIILTAWSLRNSEDVRIHTRSSKVLRGGGENEQLHVHEHIMSTICIGKHS